MNKKFLSAILFGALMVTSTGTFVSCKDYDDDIENLQSQINNLATKSDVEAKLAQLQAALNAAQAESSANAADIAALEKEVASMQDKIKAAVEADMAKYKSDIETLIEKVQGVVGEIADVVTSVELVSSYTSNFEVTEDQKSYFPNVIDFFTITEKENVFVKDVTGAIKFTEGEQTQKAVNPILVRVSPTNAVLTGDMISLVNSKGESLNEYVDIEVAPYDELMTTTRAAVKTGLWNVTVTLKKYSDELYESIKFAPESETEKVLYAVQVTNALGEESTRTATSSYDVVLGEHTDFEGANELDFIVVDANGEEHEVADVNNRHFKQEDSNSMKEAAAITYKELVWSGKAATAPVLEGEDVNAKADDDKADERSTKDVVLAVQGEPIKIKFDKDEDIYNKVAALYVTLDKANAVESAPSELNAWNSYKYEGLNEVVKGNSTTITIKGETPINDYIGFRVYAVNHDGTLVDPDGRAFYVLVGDQAQELNVVETSITPVNEEIIATEAVEVETLAELTKTYKYTWTMDKDNVPFYLQLKDAKGKTKANLRKEAPSAGNYYSDIAMIAACPEEGYEWYDYKDGKAYYGTLKVYDEVGFLVATLRVSFTKNIPAGAPEGFSIKSTQVVEGVLNCYLIPSDVTGESTWPNPAAYGSMMMNQIFNMPEGLEENYSFSFATSAPNKDGKFTETNSISGEEAIIVSKDLIDDETKHATTATYNYGMISSEAKDKEGKIIDYVVDVAEVNFETVYNCIYNDTYNWAWATREQLIKFYGESYWGAKTGEEYTNPVPELTLTYNEEYTVPGNNICEYIMGTSEVYSIYNAALAKPYMESLTVKSATFTSNENGKEEYFTPTIAEKDGVKYISKLAVIPTEHNVTTDVPSTLTIVVVDMYGHEREIKIPAVVKMN